MRGRLKSQHRVGISKRRRSDKWMSGGPDKNGPARLTLPVRRAFVDERLHAFERGVVHHVAGHGLAG
jgi:hypothetical protein